MLNIWRLIIFILLFMTPFFSASAEESVLFTAQKRFEAGRQLYDAGDFTGALSAFRSSLALHASPNTALYIARSLRHLGRLGEAVKQFEEVVRLSNEHVERKRYALALEAAQHESQQLEPHIARLSLSLLQAPEGVILSLNGQVLAMPVKLYPLDPGSAELTVEAKGIPPIKRQLLLLAGKHQHLKIQVGPAPAAQTSAKTNLAPFHTRQSAPAQMPRRPNRLRRYLRISGWSAAAAGVVSLATSLVFWRVTQKRFDTLEEECGTQPCSSAHTATIEEGRRYQLATNLSLGLGIGFAVTGGALLIASMFVESPQITLTAEGPEMRLSWIF